jgi:hypothetical protein
MFYALFTRTSPHRRSREGVDLGLLARGRLLIEALGSALLGLGAILALGHVDAVVVGVAAVGVGVDDAHAGVDRVAALGVPVDSDAVDQSRAAAVRVPVEVGRLARAGGNW